MTSHDLGLTDLNSSCSCDHGGHDAAAPAVTAALSTEYLVEGMTCSHCVASVSEELSALDGVEGVAVELRPGGRSTVAVQSAAPISEEAVRGAIAEAGYTLVSPS